MGFIDKSILDILIGQITVTEQAYREHNSHYGDVFEFKVWVELDLMKDKNKSKDNLCLIN